MSSISQSDLTWVGLDVHKDSIQIGVLRPHSESVELSGISNDTASVYKAFSRGMGPRTRLRVCYEAGPTGYELARQLQGMGIACQVIAPSLIPKAPGDKVKTDRRDARRLTRLYRAGELVSIRIPTQQEEAVRDLCRARADMVEDLTRARNRLGKFLLRHGEVWRGGSNWSLKHQEWLSSRRFDEKALEITYSHYRATLSAREAALDALSADLATFFDKAPFADAVARLSSYRGVQELGALTIASEVCDFRRFGRAEEFCGFTGLVPSEHSSGASTRRGRLTNAGNAHLRTQLVESAWAYQHRAGVGPTLRQRQEGVSPDTVARSWAAQLRLTRRFRHLASRKNVRSVVAAAVARELAGFLWAEMVA
jgi:transposase